MHARAAATSAQAATHRIIHQHIECIQQRRMPVLLLAARGPQRRVGEQQAQKRRVKVLPLLVSGLHCRLHRGLPRRQYWLRARQVKPLGRRQPLQRLRGPELRQPCPWHTAIVAGARWGAALPGRGIAVAGQVDAVPRWACHICSRRRCC